jgi:Sulfotransferase domain
VSILNRSLVYSLRPYIRFFLPKQNTETFILDRLSVLPWLRDWYINRYVGTVIISYPKCGRTWLRVMLGKVIEHHFNLGALNLSNLELLDIIVNMDEKLTLLNSKIPRIRFKHEDEPHRKTPQQLTLDKSSLKYNKIIFMVRDPRDVIVSAYFYFSKRDNFYNIEAKDLSSYLRSSVGSFDTLLTYYNIWADQKNILQDFLVLKYEDIHLNPDQELRKVLDFIGLENVSDELIHLAVEFSSFHNMRKLEEKGIVSNHLTGFNKNDVESYHVRKGKVGDYINYLLPEDIEYLNQRMNNLLSESSKETYQY